MWKRAVQVDPLADRSIPLQFQLMVPQFCLSCQHNGHGTYRIKPVIQQKPEFFQGLLFQQMCFIQDADHLFMLDTMDDLDLLLELISVGLK